MITVKKLVEVSYRKVKCFSTYNPIYQIGAIIFLIVVCIENQIYSSAFTKLEYSLLFNEFNLANFSPHLHVSKECMHRVVYGNGTVSVSMYM